MAVVPQDSPAADAVDAADAEAAEDARAAEAVTDVIPPTDRYPLHSARCHYWTLHLH